MLVFKYTKTDGAEYISHLDTLKHLCKIMRRAQLDITKSRGFNPHMHIYMNAPMGLGIKSLCEYCCLDTAEPAESFMKKFNDYTIRGLECVYAADVIKKVNVAGVISRAEYVISGLNEFEVSEVLNSEEFIITDKKGVEKNLRSRIYDARFENSNLRAVLGFGNDTLRADAFCTRLANLYGGEVRSIVKTEVYAGDKPFDEYLKEFVQEP